MARPKDRTGLVSLPISQGVERSVAFENRSKQELEKIRVKVAKALSDDMLRLYEQGEHTDLIFTNGICEIEAHKCVIQARARHLWQESWTTSRTDVQGKEISTIVLKGLTEKQISDFIRQLYTVSDSTLLIEEFLPFFPNNSGSAGSDDCKPTSTEIDSDGCSSFNLPNECAKNFSQESSSADVETDECAKNFSQESSSADVETDVQNSNGVCLRDEEISYYYKDLEDVEEGIVASNTSVKEDVVKAEEVECCVDSQQEKESVAVNVNNQFNTDNEICDEVRRDDTDVTCDSKPDLLHGREDGKEQREQYEEECGLGDVSCDHIALCRVEEGEHSVVKDLESEASAGQNPNQSSLDSQSMKVDRNIEECVDRTVDDAAPPVIQSDLSETIKNSYSLSVPYETCSLAGRDMLQMYLQQTNCDICLCVDGVRFLTHKCILASRCSYFTAMLGGKWCESQLEEIELQGISAQAMEQLLLFLYGGVIELCTPSDLMELFVIVDMYGVDTLKLVLQFYVRKDLCHFFHKPCNTCVAGASSALNLCHLFYLEDIEERCLKWTVKYFTKIWSNKAFAGLSEAVHQKCVQSMIASMTAESVLDIIMECNKLSSSLPRIKWTESILYLTTQLMDSAIEYTSSNFIKVIIAPQFLQWGKVAAWKAGALEEIFNSAIDSLPIDTACSAYQVLVDLKASQASLEVSDQNVLDLFDTMVKRCEKFLRTHIHQVARSKRWNSVNKSLQTQILNNSSYIHLDQLPDLKPRAVKRPRPFSSRLRPSASSLPSASLSASSSQQRVGSSPSLRQNKSAQSLATSQQSKSKPPSQSVGARNMASTSTTGRPSSAVSEQQLRKQRKSNLSSSPSSSLASLPSTSPANSKATRGSGLTKLGHSVSAVESKSVKVDGTKASSLHPSSGKTLQRSKGTVLRRSISPASKLPVINKSVNKDHCMNNSNQSSEVSLADCKSKLTNEDVDKLSVTTAVVAESISKIGEDDVNQNGALRDNPEKASVSGGPASEEKETILSVPNLLNRIEATVDISHELCPMICEGCDLEDSGVGNGEYVNCHNHSGVGNGEYVNCHNHSEVGNGEYVNCHNHSVAIAQNDDVCDSDCVNNGLSRDTNPALALASLKESDLSHEIEGDGTVCVGRDCNGGHDDIDTSDDPHAVVPDVNGDDVNVQKQTTNLIVKPSSVKIKFILPED